MLLVRISISGGSVRVTQSFLTSIGLLCAVIYIPLCYVRKIETFAWTHLVADVLILVAVLTCTFYAS
jgi:hypothetical protein